MSSFDTNDNLFVDAAGQAPGFTDLFGEPGFDDDVGGAASVRIERVERLADDPKPYFTNRNFYQEALTGEGEVAKRLHQILAQFLKAETPDDRSLYRGRLIPTYWELLKSVAEKAHGALPEPKKLLVRFGVLLPTMLDKEQRRMIAQVVVENQTGQPIYYVDEWLRMVARGEVGTSATDETAKPRGGEGSKVLRQIEAVRGKVEAQTTFAVNRNREIEAIENTIQRLMSDLFVREGHPAMPELKGPHSEKHRALLTDIGSELRKLSHLGREYGRTLSDLEKYQESLEELRAEAAAAGEELDVVDARAAIDEMGTIQQMAKLCVGRQGNHFPLLFHQYFRGGMASMATRENVNNALAAVEAIDPGIFERTFKQQTTRIVPNVVLVPAYGDLGICWEPFERHNRATSRGRLAIPLYPKDVMTAVVAALGDLRWQVAKEKAAHYWMEEGLTGWYYEWFTGQKGRGDVKDQFIQDYVLWITKESEGTQKLVREVRDIFWRYMPFPQPLKDELKNRGFVYQELYKKDQNRAMSDGY